MASSPSPPPGDRVYPPPSPSSAPRPFSQVRPADQLYPPPPPPMTPMYPPPSPGYPPPSAGLYPPPSPGIYPPPSPGFAPASPSGIAPLAMPEPTPTPFLEPPSPYLYPPSPVDPPEAPYPLPPQAATKTGGSASAVGSSSTVGSSSNGGGLYAPIPASTLSTVSAQHLTTPVSPGPSDIDAMVQIQAIPVAPNLTLGRHDSSPEALARQESLARREHLTKRLDMSVNEATIGSSIGIAYEFYFVFIRFIVASNILLFLASLIIMVPQTVIGKTDGFYSIFSISFPSYLTGYWKASGITQIVIWFLLPVVYWLHQGRLIKAAETSGRLRAHEGDGFFVDNTEIPTNRHLPWSQRIMRRVLTSFIYGGIIAGAYYATAGFQELSNQNRASRVGKSTGVIDLVHLTDWLISMAMTFMNFAAMFICYRLTDFERYSTHLIAWSVSIVKVFVFRVVSAVAFFTAIHRADYCSGGVKFFTLLVSDLFIGNLFELANPVLMAKIRSPWTNVNALPDRENLPEFDVAAEYVELLYRQYLLYQGSAHFPLIALLGAVINAVEYPLDKYRLLRMSKPPRIVNRTLQHEIAMVLFLVAIVGLIGSQFAPAFTYAQTDVLPLTDLSRESPTQGAVCWARFGGNPGVLVGGKTE
ncbi:hypothetical protein H9P43_003080 [Blastocladiella emersonii ATCC 22665]|nr:hypothetical protein H9P43_003080 [Blastocladiella emersonii ATCC 22665]